MITPISYPTHHQFSSLSPQILPGIVYSIMLIQTEFNVFRTEASLGCERLADGRCQNAWWQGTRGRLWGFSAPKLQIVWPRTILDAASQPWILKRKKDEQRCNNHGWSAVHPATGVPRYLDRTGILASCEDVGWNASRLLICWQILLGNNHGNGTSPLCRYSTCWKQRVLHC